MLCAGQRGFLGHSAVRVKLDSPGDMVLSTKMGQSTQSGTVSHAAGRGGLGRNMGWSEGSTGLGGGTLPPRCLELGYTE